MPFTKSSSKKSLLASVAATELQRIRATKPQKTGSEQLAEVWKPHPGPQQQFFESDCDEILYGGQAGGGKSEALTALPLLWSHIDGFLSLTLRRESTQLNDLTRKSRKLYRKAYPGLQPIKSPRYSWTFPSGAEAIYGHCSLEDDWDQFDGWEINLLNFDELTHFTETQYTYLCARVRSANPRLPTLIRATTNPGGKGHAWVFRRWGAWLDPDFEASGLPLKSERAPGPPAQPGEVWWIITLDDGTEIYSRTKPVVAEDDIQPQSRTFIPASLRDNPSLKNDTKYRTRLNSLDAVRRAQLRDGNWLIKPAAGLYFKRSWCDFVEVTDVPMDAEFCRGWDRAGTTKTKSNDPDATVGVLLARKDGIIWVVDMRRAHKTPAGVDKLMSETIEADSESWGYDVLTCVPQDPAQAGKDQAIRTVRALAGYRVKVRPETGDKVTRFGPFSAQAEHGNVRIVKAPWNNEFCDELEGFPDADHDDVPDATSTAFQGITGVSSGGGIVKISSYRGTQTTIDEDDEDDEDD